jgi:hypothetical protein
MQEAYDAMATKGANEENCWYFASRQGMELVEQARKGDTRVRIKLWLDTFTDTGKVGGKRDDARISRLNALSVKILNRAEANEPESAGAESGDTVGKPKAQPRRKSRKLTGTRSKST